MYINYEKEVKKIYPNAYLHIIKLGAYEVHNKWWIFHWSIGYPSFKEHSAWEHPWDIIVKGRQNIDL